METIARLMSTLGRSGPLTPYSLSKKASVSASQTHELLKGEYGLVARLLVTPYGEQRKWRSGLNTAPFGLTFGGLVQTLVYDDVEDEDDEEKEPNPLPSEFKAYCKEAIVHNLQRFPYPYFTQISFVEKWLGEEGTYRSLGEAAKKFVRLWYHSGFIYEPVGELPRPALEVGSRRFVARWVPTTPLPEIVRVVEESQSLEFGYLLLSEWHGAAIDRYDEIADQNPGRKGKATMTDVKVRGGNSELHAYTKLAFSDYIGRVENDLKNVRTVLSLLEHQLSPE